MTSTCLWCETDFEPRVSGGKAQRFCRPACRRAFDTACRKYLAAEVEAGRLQVSELSGPQPIHALAGISVTVRRGAGKAFGPTGSKSMQCKLTRRAVLAGAPAILATVSLPAIAEQDPVLSAVADCNEASAACDAA